VAIIEPWPTTTRVLACRKVPLTWTCQQRSFSVLQHIASRGCVVQAHMIVSSVLLHKSIYTTKVRACDSRAHAAYLALKQRKRSSASSLHPLPAVRVHCPASVRGVQGGCWFAAQKRMCAVCVCVWCCVCATRTLVLLSPLHLVLNVLDLLHDPHGGSVARLTPSSPRTNTTATQCDRE
jgi:hypothetical protein